jgi:formylglycine-generating enzyme required for sulfatase activity
MRAGQKITGPDGGQMVWVPAGEFMMGTPPHRARITKGFWLGKCEVTTAQWERYLQETDAHGWSDGGEPTPGPDYPAWEISWDDATAYCKHYGLSLPTEAQWEYAAAGPASRRYPWGDEWEHHKCCNAANLGPSDRTWPVGSFPQGASWCRALDLAGNVAEWCQDGNAYGAKVVRGGSWYLVDRSKFRCVCRYYLGATYRFDDLGFRCARTE